MEKKIGDKEMMEHFRMHRKHKGCMMLCLGALVLANAYFNVINWEYFIGGVLVIGGILKISGCCHKYCK